MLGALPVDHPRNGVLTHTVGIATAPKDDATADFVAMYEAHYPRLVRALELSGCDRPRAEDVAQEAFARTLGHWRRVRGGTNPPGYVYRTAFRLARRRLPESVLLGDERPVPDVAGEAIANVTVAEALAGMPPRRRTCAVMCFVAGLTPGEAAEALGIAAGTVRKQLEHARAELQVKLDR